MVPAFLDVYFRKQVPKNLSFTSARLSQKCSTFSLVHPPHFLVNSATKNFCSPIVAVVTGFHLVLRCYGGFCTAIFEIFLIVRYIIS